MIRRFRMLAAVSLTAMLAMVAGCSSSDDEGGEAVDKVGYVTGFGAVGRDAFVWVAQEKGYFKDAGIEVTIQKGAGTVQNLTLLKSDKVQFAALDFTGAEIQAGTAKFADWRAVAAIHQRTLVSIMTTKDTGITSPKDLAGKTIATGAGSVSEFLFPAYAKAAGLDPASVTIKGVQPPALNGLMAKRQVDALSAFLLSRTALANASKKEVVVMPYSDYLGDLYGNVIITKPSLISSDKDLVQRFVGAAMKGLQYSIDHPDEAAQILNKAEPTALVPGAIGEINAMKPYVAPSNGTQLGGFDEKQVARSIAAIQAGGLMPAGLTPDKVVDATIIPKS